MAFTSLDDLLPQRAGFIPLIALALLSFWWLRLSRRNFPPGPPAFPLIGNLLSLPRSDKARLLRDLAESKVCGLTRVGILQFLIYMQQNYGTLFHQVHSYPNKTIH
jgi:hypothetical protein